MKRREFLGIAATTSTGTMVTDLDLVSNPEEHIDTELVKYIHDYKAWANEYFEHEERVLTRWIVKDPSRTMREKEGNCADFALLSASWCAKEYRECKFVWCWSYPLPLPTHIFLYDDHQWIYDNGTVEVGSLSEKKEQYFYTIEQKIDIPEEPCTKEDSGEGGNEDNIFDPKSAGD